MQNAGQKYEENSDTYRIYMRVQYVNSSRYRPCQQQKVRSCIRIRRSAFCLDREHGTSKGPELAQLRSRNSPERTTSG